MCLRRVGQNDGGHSLVGLLCGSCTILSLARSPASGLLHGFAARGAGPHENGYALGSDACWALSATVGVAAPTRVPLVAAVERAGLRAIAFVCAGAGTLRTEGTHGLFPPLCQPLPTSEGTESKPS